MASLRQILRENDSPDDDSRTIQPEKRGSHECALVDDHLHLFGGRDRSKFFPRNEIFVMNGRRAEKKWIRRLTRGRTIPPPCLGARCVVIDKMIYSYGGKTEKRRRLGIVYRLDPKKMEWLEVATPIGGKKPHERSHCCLCAIGSRMIMFGGISEKKIPRGQLQSGATQDKNGWSNDIYEFRLEEGNEKGMWLDLELSGTRPKPFVFAAMATIDEHRALLHGRDVEKDSQSILIDLNRKLWTIIDFNVKPSPRHDHTICQLVTEGLEDESMCLLVGGRMVDQTNSDYVYVLDCDNSKAYQMDVNPQLGKVMCHTFHSVQNEDKTTDVIVCGGFNWDWTLRPILCSFCLDVKNEPYMKIRRDILSSRRASVRAATSSPRLSLPSDREDIGMMQRELEHLRRRCSELTEEKSSIRNELVSAQSLLQKENTQITEELTSSHRLVERKDGEIAQIGRELASVQREASIAQRRLEQEKDQQISSIQQELATSQRLAQDKDGVITRIREELASCQRFLERKDADISQIRVELASVQRNHSVALTRCQTLEASRNEMKRRLEEFTDVLNIREDEVHLTDQKVGSGGFASVFVSRWRGMTVAVKKIHELITNQRNMALFEQEVLVCSRLHHPNIMTVCGAVMAEGIPLQMVMELLEGSVSEVIDAAHTTGSYLTIYEQLSIAIDMTSGISYLHQIRPRPYVHGDVRPSNILVTRDMKVKVGDLGTAHLIESSLSAGPVSQQYLAPERSPRSDGTAAASSLPSDVYSVGVSLIEIFTGVGPIPEVRQTQLDALANRPNLLMLCSRLIDDDPNNRPSAQECFDALRSEFSDSQSRLSALGLFPTLRLVKGVFGRDSHKVVLSGSFY